VALLHRPFDQFDVGEARQRAAGARGKIGIALHRDDMRDQPGEHRRGITGGGADQKHAIGRPETRFGQQPPRRDRQVQRASAAQWDGSVAICERRRLRRHEPLARDLGPRDHHPRIVDRIGPQLAHHHRGAHRLEFIRQGRGRHHQHALLHNCFTDAIH